METRKSSIHAKKNKKNQTLRPATAEGHIGLYTCLVRSGI